MLESVADLASTDGTYVHRNFADDPVVLDVWGRPTVLQIPSIAECDVITGLTATEAGYCARLVSAGPGQRLGITNADIETAIADNRDPDDRVLYLTVSIPTADINLDCE